jgi:glutamate racemase
MPAIRRIVRADVTIIDPAPAIARQVSRVLAQRNLKAPADHIAQHHFYTSGDVETLAQQAQRLVNYTGNIEEIGNRK